MIQLNNMRDNPKLLISIIYGISGGLTLGLLKSANVDATRPYSWIVFFGYMLLFSYDNRIPLWKSILLTLIASGLIAETWAGANTSTFSSFLLITISTYAINAYNIAYHKAGYPFSYPHLFHAVWDTINKLLIAFIVTMTALIVVGLTASIFLSVNLKLISDFLTKSSTLWTILYFFSMVGLYIAELSENVIRQLRTLLLNTCKLFLPIISVITIGYLIMLICSLLFGGKLAFSFPTYQTLALLGILFINGVFQLGEVTQPYNEKLTRLVNVFITVLPVIPVLSMYALYVTQEFGSSSIKTNGFNVTNYIPFLLALLLLVYSLSYSNVLRRNHATWMATIKNTNILLGYLVILVTLITNNTMFSKTLFSSQLAYPEYRPIVIPKESSARNQVIKNAGIIWAPPQQATANKPITVNYHGDTPVYLCRYKGDTGYHAGIVIHGECVMVTQYRMEKHGQYEILSGNADNINWVTYPVKEWVKKNNIVITMRDDLGHEVNVCRTIKNNRLFVGESDASGLCIFIDENNNYNVNTIYEILAVKIN